MCASGSEGLNREEWLVLMGALVVERWRAGLSRRERKRRRRGGPRVGGRVIGCDGRGKGPYRGGEEEDDRKGRGFRLVSRGFLPVSLKKNPVLSRYMGWDIPRRPGPLPW
jgi:hypothetical protein